MKKRSLKLNSIITEIHKLEKFVEEICDEHNINNTYFGNILLTLTEAFENAIFNGNGSDPTNKVSSTIETTPKGLLFEVHDEGKGFDFLNIPDATDVVGNPDKKGTGIFMIKALADEINFIDKGRGIQILFYIASINQQIAVDRIQSLQDFIKTGKEEKAKKA